MTAVHGDARAILGARARLALTLPRVLVIVCTDAPFAGVFHEAVDAGAELVLDTRGWTADQWHAANMARPSHLAGKTVLVLRDADHYARARRLAMDLIDVASCVQLAGADGSS